MNEFIATHVITGFLGSGKTTLLNSLLTMPAFSDTAVIVNEFGDIGIDHLLIESASDNVILLANGCLCCAASDSLRETLSDLYRRRAASQIPAFRRVVIETSGLADPGPILQTLYHDPLLAGRFRPHPLVCVVDAIHWHESLNEPEALSQIAMAERIIVTKTEDRSIPTDLSRRLGNLAPNAVILLSAAIRKEPALLIDDDPNGSWRAPAGHHHDHASDIMSLSFPWPTTVSWAGIAAWTEHLRQAWGLSLLRTKAILAVSRHDQPVVIQGVRKSFDLRRLPSWPNDDPSGRIVLIGRGLDEIRIHRGLDWLDLSDGISSPDCGGFPERERTG